ncbi:MAG: DoxX family protein [Myxococcales bacterium]|nr:DoxX family protein [Myxococcales bacterium]
MNAKTRTIIYWLATALITLPIALAGVMHIIQPPEMVQNMTHLGFPLYVATILGVWKLLSVPALLAPGLGRLKEWAYAGIAFDLIGASASHFAVGDGAGLILTPLVLLAIAAVSWGMRPASRRLASSAVPQRRVRAPISAQAV